MKNEHIKILNCITTIVVVVLLLAGIGASILIFQKLDFSYYTNDIRIALNAHRLEAEKGEYEPCDYAYLVMDVEGNVLYADADWKRKVGDTVVVEEMLQQDKNFAKEHKDYGKCALTLTGKDGSCTGFIVYLLPKEMIQGKTDRKNMILCFWPVAVAIFISVIVLIVRAVYTNARILKPLQQISISAQAIIAGNYDMEVRRTYGENLKNDEVGELTYSFEMMRDELKAKQINEQTLRKAQQELMSCISHDLRTPISTIKAYSEGLRDGIIMEGMEQKDYLDIILQKTNLLEKMIGELLAYSNTQLNKMDIVPKEIYFREYIMEIARELRIFVQRYDVNFQVVIMDEDLIVNMDEKRITEVIYNLIENSLKYLDCGKGEIRFEARIENDTASIHISDNGMGISAEDIPYVFDKFYRAEKSRSSNIPGSGLGLSICKYIVNQHGGEIFCRSGKGQGSEFWFTLNDSAK